MPTGYFRRLSIKKTKPRIIFFFILHFLPPKFCDFCFYSTTLQYNFWKILTFRYNRYQDKLHRRSDDKEFRCCKGI